MKKMSTKKNKTRLVKSSLLTFVFLFMGLLGVNAQTASQMSAEKASGLMANLHAHFLDYKGELQSTTGQSATDIKLVMQFYKKSALSFKKGENLAETMDNLIETADAIPSYLSQDEIDALHVQIDKIKNSTPGSQKELNDFHVLLTNSKN